MLIAPTIPKILIGADPEVFVVRNGVFISGHGLVPGDKYDPHPVGRGAVQVDGTALEFNIDPAENEEEFEYNISTVFGQLKGMVPKDCMLVTAPVARYSSEEWDMIPPYAKRLGCEPDYNAWTGEKNPTPNSDVKFRTASGHIHIGFTKDKDPFSDQHMDECCTIVKQLDYYLGLMSLAWDPDNTRRELYGQAGAFRPKPYGVEYRVLSNAWLKSSSLTKWIFRQTVRAMHDLYKENELSLKFGEFPITPILSGDNQWHRRDKGQLIYKAVGPFAQLPVALTEEAPMVGTGSSITWASTIGTVLASGTGGQ
jgi:hypothetical protein